MIDCREMWGTIREEIKVKYSLVHFFYIYKCEKMRRCSWWNVTQHFCKTWQNVPTSISATDTISSFYGKTSPPVPVGKRYLPHVEPLYRIPNGRLIARLNFQVCLTCVGKIATSYDEICWLPLYHSNVTLRESFSKWRHETYNLIYYIHQRQSSLITIIYLCIIIFYCIIIY